MIAGDAGPRDVTPAGPRPLVAAPGAESGAAWPDPGASSCLKREGYAARQCRILVTWVDDDSDAPMTSKLRTPETVAPPAADR